MAFFTKGNGFTILVFMQLLNFQKNNSILYFLKGYVDKFLQGFEQEFILHTRIYFQLFTFLFAIF
jgi:hypothetical protein